MLTAALLLVGAALLALAFSERALRVLPLTPALLYLALGGVAGALLGAPSPERIARFAPVALVVLELVLLVSLFAIGLRLRFAAGSHGWRVALLLAGPALLVAVALGALLVHALFDGPWALAIIVAAILAPTDPVLASDVKVTSEHDRDVVRLSLTAEGALNDGSALPAVMAGLWLLQRPLAEAGGREALALVWPVAGGALLGVALGWGLGLVVRARVRRGDTLARDELLSMGAVVLAYGAALATHTSTFVLGFALAATLLHPLRRDALTPGEGALAERLHAFGARLERLVEAVMVMAVGVGLAMVAWSLPVVLMALAAAFVVRPLSVLAVVRTRAMPPHQRRLVAWFGIRGVGSLYYAAYVLAHGPEVGLDAPAAAQVLSVTLVAVAASIVLHGLSVTQAMQAYRARSAADGG